MKQIKILFGLFFLLFSLSACGPKLITKQQAFPEMYQEKPVSLLVLPPINQSTAADAKECYNSTIAEPLTMNGYYVFPLEVVTEILESEGIYDTEQLLDTPPQKFKDSFGADAVMFIIINGWDTSYYVIGGDVTVSITYMVKSTETGATLWHLKDTMKVDTTGENRVGGIAGLVLQVVETAVTTAMTDYVPVARRLNSIALVSIPAGKYHPSYGKDMQQQILQAKVKPE